MLPQFSRPRSKKLFGDIVWGQKRTDSHQVSRRRTLLRHLLKRQRKRHHHAGVVMGQFTPGRQQGSFFVLV